MINNRQAGRRRGRGGQRSQGGNPGRPDNGNRIDNRARGNAAQLLEKYKSLARDAQMQGDRVNTEYYLQFADHYFRVLNENRSRFEENQARRGAPEAFEADDDEDFDGENFAEDRVDGERAAQANGNRRDGGLREPGDGDREPRRENGPDAYRDTYREGPRPRPRDEDRAAAAPQAGQRADEEGAPSRADPSAPIEGAAQRRGRPRRAATDEADAPAIDADRLPPALSISAFGDADDDADAAPKPRRRRARPAESETTQAG